MQVTQRSVEVVSTDLEIVARVAAVDVGKDAGVVCVRTPRESRPGQRATRVWTVPARTAAITALAGQAEGVEKLIEDALIKLSSVATNIMGVSGRAMLAALIDGERDSRVLAEMAKGRLRTKRAALIDALTGRFDEHHAELIDMLLN